jgi:hypothetical protein
LAILAKRKHDGEKFTNNGNDCGEHETIMGSGNGKLRF